MEGICKGIKSGWLRIYSGLDESPARFQTLLEIPHLDAYLHCRAVDN